jgi:hypothetical protein
MATTQTPTKTNGGSMLVRGYTHDPECGRTTNRIQTALRMLADMGVKPTYVEHSDTCICNPKNRWNQVHGYYYHCDADCPRKNNDEPVWPVWATGEMFDLAYRLASEVISQRGEYNRTSPELRASIYGD